MPATAAGEPPPFMSAASVCLPAPRTLVADLDASAVELAYVELREQILIGALKPGEALQEYRLAQALDVSRTPVREAMRRLQAAGLVTSVPHRGVYVRDLGARDVVEIFELREQLESLAVRNTVERGVLTTTIVERWADEQLHAQNALRAGWMSEAYDLGSGIHRELAHLASNGRLTDAVQSLDEQLHLVGAGSFSTGARAQAALDEHLTIIAALRNRDGRAAERAMRAHLRLEGETVLRALLTSRAD